MILSKNFCCIFSHTVLVNITENQTEHITLGLRGEWSSSGIPDLMENILGCTSIYL